MSLTKDQKIATKQELAENLALTNLKIAEIAADLNTSEAKIERILNLKQNSLNDGWIFRNYLLKKVAEKGLTPVPPLTFSFHVGLFFSNPLLYTVHSSIAIPFLSLRKVV
ncbi:DUF2316 family protein [Listeria ivanovii]|uniref:DUF2316 family protein n=1 Tax=Listeria ivanovii TaxID=1638 RepID=UPI001F36ADB6|nr:DUF2316 family protein [Listeria ivanovii]